jgi:hypothetical protein
MMRRTVALLAPLAALLMFASTASAHHVTASCVTQGNKVIGTAQWYAWGDGHTATLEIQRINPRTDQFFGVVAGPVTKPVHEAPVYLSYDVPNVLPNGAPRTETWYFRVKAWSTVDGGIYYKTANECAVPPPVYDCKGNLIPPGTPVTPPSVLCPPPVVPPVPPVTQPQPPPVPPVPPNPPVVKQCKGPYRVTVSRGPSQYRFRFRNQRGKLVQAVWYVDGKRKGKAKVLKVRRGSVNRTVVARHGVFPRDGSCAAQWIKPRRSTPPRTVG